LSDRVKNLIVTRGKFRYQWNTNCDVGVNFDIYGAKVFKNLK